MIDLDHLTTLTDAEARDLLAAVYAEVQRRDAIAKAPAQAEALATRRVLGGGIFVIPLT